MTTKFDESAKYSKQELMDIACSLLGIQNFKCSNGATEPREFFTSILESLNISYPLEDSKPALARLISGHGFQSWDRNCESAGSTVTNEGLRRVCIAVQTLVEARSIQRVSIENNDEFSVDVRPDATALRIFKNMSFSEWFALGEFIDNSLTSALPNLSALRAVNGSDYSLDVEIDFDSVKRQITISDNAAGISKENIASAVRTGSLPPDAISGLSVHGVGMKAAAFWWGSKLEIETYPLGSSNGWFVKIDLDVIDETRDGNIVVKEIPPRGYSGTVIRVSNLNKNFPGKKSIAKINSYLPSIYRTFLRNDEFKDANTTGLIFSLMSNGEYLHYETPDLLNEPLWSTKLGSDVGAKSRHWYLEFDLLLSSSKSIRGWIGILETGSRDQAGFFLHFRGKGVSGVAPTTSSKDSDIDLSASRSAYKPKEIFRQSGNYLDQRIIGEIDISDFGKTLTTDDVVWSAEDESEVIEKLLEILKENDFIKMGLNFRPTVKTKNEKIDELEIAKDEAIQIQKNAESGGFTHGLAPDIDDSIPTTEFIRLNVDGEEEEVSFTLNEAPNHEHRFNIHYFNDSTKPFITVFEDRETDVHEVRINTNHPALDFVGPLNVRPEVKKLITRLAFNLAAAEVFLESAEKRIVRNKFNELLRRYSVEVED
jgi:hypothetical protein